MYRCVLQISLSFLEPSLSAVSMETPGLKSQLFPVELSQMETRTPGFPWKKQQQQPDPDGFPKLELEPPHAGGIKPKGEPCEEQEHSPAAAPDDDWEMTPLSGDHPFFTTVMSKSQVQKQFQLVRRGTHAMPCIIPSGSASGSSLTLKEGILSCAHQVIPARLQRLLPEARVPAALLCHGPSWAASKPRSTGAAWDGEGVPGRRGRRGTVRDVGGGRRHQVRRPPRGA